MRGTVEQIFVMCTIVLIIAIFSAAIYMRSFSSPSSGCVVPEHRATHLLSVKEVQQVLLDAGYYHGKVDGKVSPDYQNSKTQKAWDRYCADQDAGLFHSEDANDIQIFGSTNMGRYIDGIK